VLDQLTNGPGRFTRFGKVLAELDDVARYTSASFSTTSKRHGGGHVARGVRIAERMCERLGFEQESAARVIFLVRQHLLMSHISQRRDVSEEGLVEGFAEKVGDLTNLNMLLLLTYADTSAVGPGVWNGLEGLFAVGPLHKGALAPDRRTLSAVGLRSTDGGERAGDRGTPAEIMPSEMERHFAMMPDRYFRATEPLALFRIFN